jgi:chromosome segregation ATPase
MNREYKTELETAREELADMFREKEELETRIARQQRKVAALAVLSDESEDTDDLLALGLGGLSSACRSVFRASTTKLLTPVEIRDRLRQLQFPIHEYKNILASIHNTLKRLEAKGEVKMKIRDVHEEHDESVYQWIGESYGASGMRAALQKTKK